MEVDVRPPMRESKAAVAVEVAVVALCFDGGSDGAVVHLLEMQGRLGLTLVREAEATSLPTSAFAVPFSTADVALTAVDEAVDVRTAGGVVGDWPVLEGVDGARVRIRHSPRMGGALLGRPSVDGADEPVGVAANLGVSCLAFGHGSLEILAFFVADPPLSGGQARGRLQPFGSLPPRVSLAD